MIKNFLFLFFNIFFTTQLFSITGEEILKKVDKNLNFNSATMSVRIEIYLPNQPVRVKKFNVWIKGINSYVEFLNKEDKHIRYLKLGKKMWVYDKEEENTFLISGHLLKQGMMGSDISYEDIMESDEVYKKYEIELLGEEQYNSYDCYLILLTSKVKDVSYFRRKMWVSKKHFVPLKEERYAKNGKLLKVYETSELKFYEHRVYPAKSVVSDKLKTDTKTVVIIEQASFDISIPEDYFSRRYLER